MLHVSKVSIEDTLLDLGGDSLTAITLSTKILSRFNVQMNIKDLLSNVDNETFKAKVEASGFTSGTQVQICKWEATD